MKLLFVLFAMMPIVMVVANPVPSQPIQQARQPVLAQTQLMNEEMLDNTQPQTNDAQQPPQPMQPNSDCRCPAPIVIPAPECIIVSKMPVPARNCTKTEQFYPSDDEQTNDGQQPPQPMQPNSHCRCPLFKIEKLPNCRFVEPQ